MLLTGVYFNLETGLLGGPYYYPVLHKRRWAQRSEGLGSRSHGDRICTHRVPWGQDFSIHIYSTVQERGCLPVQGKAAAQEDEDTHTAFFTTEGTDREAAGIMHLGSSLKRHGEMFSVTFTERSKKHTHRTITTS